jgi:hypothetical protein
MPLRKPVVLVYQLIVKADGARFKGIRAAIYFPSNYHLINSHELEY